jgi:hypothetical protein
MLDEATPGARPQVAPMTAAIQPAGSFFFSFQRTKRLSNNDTTKFKGD